ncbi:DUF1805 domain-containing protein [Candidatus Micrarchaeota archaeon]|nr:DUF1805 domain-containing protein [Candidatus Micrarchaeota archaeon]
METEMIETKRGAALGIRVELPGAPLLLIKAEKGYIACGYFDSKTVEKVSDPAVVVRGVRSFEEMLKSRVSYVSKRASELGVRDTMTGAQALDRMI